MEYIDDHAVIRYQVRFRDRIEIPEDQAANVRDGNIMVWLVRTECLPPSYHPVTKDSEDRYRFNIQAVHAAVPLKGPQREAGLVFLESGSDQGYLAFEAPSYSENGLHDPLAQHDELEEIAKVLATHGIVPADGETLGRCLDRVLPAVRFPDRDPDPDPQPTDGPEYHEDHAAWDRRQFPDGTGVEVVGSIYSNGKSKDRQLIEEAFGS